MTVQGSLSSLPSPSLRPFPIFFKSFGLFVSFPLSHLFSLALYQLSFLFCWGCFLMKQLWSCLPHFQKKKKNKAKKKRTSRNRDCFAVTSHTESRNTTEQRTIDYWHFSTVHWTHTYCSTPHFTLMEKHTYMHNTFPQTHSAADKPFINIWLVKWNWRWKKSERKRWEEDVWKEIWRSRVKQISALFTATFKHFCHASLAAPPPEGNQSLPSVSQTNSLFILECFFLQRGKHQGQSARLSFIVDFKSGAWVTTCPQTKLSFMQNQSLKQTQIHVSTGVYTKEVVVAVAI